MMRWFTSDWHLDHGQIIDFSDRPFLNTKVMNQALIDNVNEVVQDDDELWLIGDMAMGVHRDSVARLAEVKGQKFLVPGNHDPVHKMHKRWKKFLPLYEDAGITVLESQVVINVGDTPVLLCHFPYSQGLKPGYDDKFSGVRPDDLGFWLICGHIHQGWTLRDRMINVGVDVWDYRPVPEPWIAEIINGEPLDVRV